MLGLCMTKLKADHSSSMPHAFSLWSMRSHFARSSRTTSSLSLLTLPHLKASISDSWKHDSVAFWCVLHSKPWTSSFSGTRQRVATMGGMCLGVTVSQGRHTAMPPLCWCHGKKRLGARLRFKIVNDFHYPAGEGLSWGCQQVLDSKQTH